MSAATVLYVIDLPRMSAFYEHTLGLVQVTREDSYRVLESEAWSLTLVQAPDRIAERITLTDPPRRREDAVLKPVFLVRSLSEAREAAAASGGRIDPADTQWEFYGAVRCDGIDPEGNVIQLRQLTAAAR